MPTVTVNGSLMDYMDTGGEGTAVLLLHAFPLDAGMWEQQIESLRGHFRVVAPNLKGFGGSDAPEDAAEYSMDGYANDLKALLDELGIDKAAVLGLSMGGYVAFALLRLHPERISALVLADTRAEADPPEGKDKRSAQQKQVQEEGTAGLIDTLAGALLGAKTRQESPEMVEHTKGLMQAPAAGFIGGLEAMKNRPDSTGDLTKIDVPTLVIVGEDDGVTPPEASRKIHEHVGGSQLVVLPGVGHLSNLEAPEEFTGAVEGFLRGLPG
jgi:pimeloyl-ACP methyl ester carboxylesterase